MAQFVVIWSIFLYASCLLLLSSAEVPQQQQQQQLTKVPLVSSNVVEMIAGVGGQGGVGVGVGVAGGVGGAVAPSVGSVAKEKERVYYHPAAVTKPRIIDQYDHRSLDGHFEYRYLLSNGEARYERAYWLPAGKNMVLARKGYYSYPISNNKFLTVFYTADENGYRQDSTTFSRTQPHLPRSIEVPEYVPQSVYAAHSPVTQHHSKPHVHTSTTTSRPFVPSTDNPFIQLKPTAPPHVPVHQSIVSHGQHLYGHQSQAQHSSVHSSSAAHSSVGGHVASDVHTSTGAHHSAGAHSASIVSSSSGAHTSIGVKPGAGQVWQSSIAAPASSNAVSSSGVSQSSGVHSQAIHPAVPSQSAVHSPSVVQHGVESHSQVGVHPTVPFQPAVISSWAGQSSVVHSQTGGHSEVPTAATVHPSVGAYSPPSVHSPSVVQTSTGVHSTAVHHSRPTVRPSNQVYQYQSVSQGSSAQPSVGVPPTVASPIGPVQSWHYSF
ncbi:sialidase-like [Bactrocera tryoni]|uniref:sialidase-like n=1 Tax=Bactrocera tryoni TaxID=59916 RepID=UPI001A983631|nr:sialidase-like [Bactrocera tryoni]